MKTERRRGARDKWNVETKDLNTAVLCVLSNSRRTSGAKVTDPYSHSMAAEENSQGLRLAESTAT